MPAVPLLAALLLAAPTPALRGPFQGIDEGGGANAPLPAGPALASVGLGIAGGLVLGIAALALQSTPFGPALPFAAIVADWGLQTAIPALFGLPRSLTTSAVGMLGGIVLGAVGAFGGGAFGRAVNPPGGFNDIVFALLGIVLGVAIAPPILTVLDPFGLSPAPVTLSDRIVDARPLDRG